MPHGIAATLEAYERAIACALDRWSTCPGVGQSCDPPFHPTNLALGCGDYLRPGESVLALRDELAHRMAGDARADVQPAASLHFTFLALTQQLYPALDALPDLDELRAVFEAHCRGRYFSVRELRLVALPNALLLAGVPDEATLELRRTFTEALLRTPWRDRLLARYGDGPVPPLFWHSTLLRYHAACVPASVRGLFREHQTTRFGDVQLPVRLVASSYNWAAVTVLAG